MKSIKSLGIFVFFLFCFGNAYGQGWVKTFPSPSYAERNILQTADGGYVFTMIQFANNDDLFKIDAFGQLQWQKDHASQDHYITDIFQSSSGMIYESISLISMFNSQLQKSDGAGNIIWTYTDTNYHMIQKSVQISNSDIISSYYNQTNPQGVYLAKTDTNGNRLWEKQYSPGSSSYAVRDLTSTLDGGFVLAGNHYSAATGSGGFIWKFNANGDSLWFHKFTIPGSNASIDKIVSTPDLGFVAVGDFQNSLYRDIFTLKLDSAGNIIWDKYYYRTFYWEAVDIEITPNGNYLIAGMAKADSITPEFAFTMKINSSGDSLWYKSFFDNASSSQVKDLLSLPNEHFIMLGQVNDNGNKAFILKADSFGITFTNQIFGKVFSDFNNDCIQSSGDTGLHSLVLDLSNSNHTNFSISDSTGSFLIEADSGSYYLKPHFTSPYWQMSSCAPDSIPVTFNGFYDTVNVEVPITPTVLCPYMTVDITTPLIRCIQPNVYSVSYCNEGTVPADSAYILVHVDTAFTVTSSSIPWSQALPNNVYRFDLDSVDVFECGSFQIWVTLPCDSTTLIGQTYCTEAYIYPDSICSPPVTWDNSRLSVTSDCKGDSVEFVIKNIGAPMTASTDLFVIEDDIMSQQMQINLGTNGEYKFTIPTDGSTYRVTAENTPDNPYEPYVTSAIELCRQNSSVTPTLGFVTQFPQNDASPFVAIDCHQSIAAYDPNDKTVFPVGVGAQKIITKDMDLKYIIRFQNTGNDTAFNIFILDTLPDHVDLATFKAGAASHDYTVQMHPGNIVYFSFNDIMLPDSNVNEPLSHGFVSFTIKQKPNNPDGTVIANDAGIYFDFNAPIITNEDFNTIGKIFIQIQEVEGKKHLIKAYPNPANDYFIVEAEGDNQGEIEVAVYSLNGQHTRSYRSSGTNNVMIPASGFKNGMYFFEVKIDGEKAGAGKILIQK